MKKLTTLLTALILVFSIGTAAMASTIGVNVSEGYSLSVEKGDLDNDSFDITGNIGISPKTLFWVGYSTEAKENGIIENPATLGLGVRYELMEDFAGILEAYSNDNEKKYCIGLRDKVVITKPFAFVGEAVYALVQPDKGDDFTRYDLTAQAEYSPMQMVTLNLGLKYQETDVEGADEEITYLAGFEFYPTDRITCWVDYEELKDSDEDGVIGAGLEFKF
ncbi:MAG TPA: hypothetical protein VEC37_03200 [Bacillota bacterium]|nr:hypothetical protein [Bacillota bacterium]